MYLNYRAQARSNHFNNMIPFLLIILYVISVFVAYFGFKITYNTNKSHQPSFSDLWFIFFPVLNTITAIVCVVCLIYARVIRITDKIDMHKFFFIKK